MKFVPVYVLFGLKNPFVMASYQWEDNVGFDYPKGFTTDHKDYVSVGAGAQLPKNLYFTVLAIPKVRGSKLTIEEVHAEIYLRFNVAPFSPR